MTDRTLLNIVITLGIIIVFFAVCSLLFVSMYFIPVLRLIIPLSVMFGIVFMAVYTVVDDVRR